MNSISYYKLIWKNHRSFAIFSMVFITLLQFLILYLITTFDLPAIISTLLAQMPEKLKIYLSESFFSTLSLDGAAAFGFNHPLVLTLLAINAINIPMVHISREMESGHWNCYWLIHSGVNPSSFNFGFRVVCCY